MLCTRTTRSRLPSIPNCTQQIRHASLIRRPKRPYTFTQLITLSDGSTFVQRTTSPQPVYRCTRDTKNHVLWNPSSQKLMNIEADEAGKLKRFRRKFGRGFDVEEAATEESQQSEEEGGQKQQEEEEDANLIDLIAGFNAQEAKKGKSAGKVEAKEKSGKGTGGER